MGSSNHVEVLVEKRKKGDGDLNHKKINLSVFCPFSCYLRNFFQPVGLLEAVFSHFRILGIIRGVRA